MKAHEEFIDTLAGFASRQEIQDAMVEYYSEENPLIPDIENGELYFEPYHVSVRDGAIVIYRDADGPDTPATVIPIYRRTCQEHVNTLLDKLQEAYFGNL